MKTPVAAVRKSLAELNVPAEEIEKLIAAGVESGKYEPGEPQVSLDEFKNQLAEVAKSIKTMTESKKPAPAAAPAAATQDPFDDELAAKLDAFVAEEDRRYTNVAKGFAAIGDLLGKAVEGITKISAQMNTLAAAQQTELAEVKKSLAAPTRPKSVQAPGDTTTTAEGAKTEQAKRETVQKALRANMPKMKDMEPAEAAKWARANAMFSAWNSPDEIADIIGISL